MALEAKKIDFNYDFQNEQQAVKQPPELTVNKKAGISRSLMLQMAFSVALLAIMSIGYIGTNLKLYEVTSEISLLQSDYNALVSENQRLSVELESKISLRNVEEEALMNLGMGEMEPYQIEYVNLSGEDTVILPAEKETPYLDMINDMVKVFKDYIGV